MLKHYAVGFIQLGQNVEEALAEFGGREALAEIDKKPIEPLSEEARENLTINLKYIHAHCKRMGLKVSTAVLEKRLPTNDLPASLPETRAELQTLLDVVMTELKEELFLYVPAHRAKYYELIFQSFITTAFPLASKELVSAGNSLAAGLYTACVFHSMRAAEIGLRVLGKTLNVTFPDRPIELAEWQNILDQVESKIREMQKAPTKDRKFKDEELHFFAQAAKQFIYFKDAWRVRVAHARETYEEVPAIRVFSHTVEFFEVLATRLSEPKPSV